MKYQTATAYACVAYRTIEKDEMPMTEENLEMVMGILYDFYSEKEIGEIYRSNIHFDSYQMIMEEKNKNKSIIFPMKRNTILIKKSQNVSKKYTSWDV